MPKGRDNEGVRALPSSTTRRGILGAAAALPIAAVPALANAPTLHPNDAELLRLERALMAVDAEQERLADERDTLARGGKPGARYAAIEARQSVLTAEGHALHDQVIDTPAVSDAGRQAKARVILRWVLRDADGWPAGEDAVAWSLARDVLGITDGPAMPEGLA